jgi:signal transduction histidine kinase
VLVEDDGIGPRELHHTGMGLIGIGERVRELNGVASFSPGETCGSVLRIDLPLLVEQTI